MSNGDAEAHLPDTIELTLGEAADLLFLLDRALEMGEPDSAYYQAIRSGIRLLTRKVWPDLGHILDEDEE